MRAKDHGFEIIAANTREQLELKEIADALNELYGESKPVEPAKSKAKDRVRQDERHPLRKVRERNVPVICSQNETPVHHG